METNSEKTEECSLKIGTIWSEVDESMLVKEEIFSDVEPDSINCAQYNVDDCAVQQTDPLVEDENNCPDTALSSSMMPLKKKAKTKSQKSEETEVAINYKFSCVHDTKNFKIIKRRLRCGDCKSLVCPECCKVMIPNLQSHFLGSGVCSSGTYFCKSCSIIFRSLCALQAHIRIHTMDIPYVCPDCGLIYNNIYFLILHLLNKCYHVYKVVRYKCKQCPGTSFSPETFVQHINEKHIHCVFRCLYCSSLFNNYEDFNYHMETLHQKYKVQYLNYYRCSLCTNMVIPKFMFQRHVAQHRENSEFYEVHYQCLCGETYNLIGAFRSHFTYCPKKGILPPKWSFLQRKLRTYGVIHENIQTKDLAIQSSPVYLRNDANNRKLSVVESDNKILISDKDKVVDVEIPGKNNQNEPVKNLNSEISGKNICRNENSNGDSSTSGSFKSLGNSVSNVEAQGEKSTQRNSNQVDTEVTIINEVKNVQLDDKCKKLAANESKASESNNKTGEQENCKSKKGSEQTNDDISKMYDYIPCDHLGYLIKKLNIEQHKNPNQGDDIVVEKCFSPKSYKIVTQLDEKTGLITTKTIPLEELEEENENSSENYCDVENSSSVANQYCNDKLKSKIENSLSCPFCIVLFPKHNLTFQQFRLHLESYHPDAALNITVNKEENKEQEKLDSAEAENNVNESKDSKGDDENNQSSNKNSEKETNSKENQNENQDLSLLNSGKKPEIVIDEGTSSKLEKEGEGEEFSETSKTLKDDFQSEKTSDDKNDQNSPVLGECQVETVNTHIDMNSLVEEVEIRETKGKSIEDEPNAKEKRSDFEPLLVSIDSNKDEMEERASEKQNFESEDKISPKSLPDLDYEGDTSKDSNWSEISGKDSKSVSPTESKAEEKERSRRESEVWSKFYESLMLAEKLKKRKNPSPESEGQKKSVVSDYSSKRVVKKPKRYRESSESDDSNDISESDEGLLMENDFIDKIHSEEKGAEDEQLNKRQILVNKLENGDGKFVDYLFDLVTKKEKLFELYKKHSTLRTNRYSHDLRSYRRKVLNGIKQRGRPHKILRYHELLKNKKLLGERNQPKKKYECSPENKINEKKRGRPRKAQDAARLKERRRSNKEVDFIEKNFEREEGDMSPSKRKRKLSSKLQYYRKVSDEKDDFSSGQVISNKPTDSNKRFTCAVCKEVFPEQSQFREHIVTHRMEENTYQCMECGECFVVRPSLEKHLHAFHKIKNTDKYITENECCNIKKEVIEEDSEPLKENQCKVCKDQFDRPIDLTKHFRIHGMAFLKEFKKEGKPSKTKP